MARKLGPKLPISVEGPSKRSSSVRMSGPMARKVMQGMGVGKKGRFVVGGKVKRLNSDEYDDSIELEMDHCAHHQDENPKSLSQAMRRRKMHNGRYA